MEWTDKSEEGGFGAIKNNCYLLLNKYPSSYSIDSIDSSDKLTVVTKVIKKNAVTKFNVNVLPQTYTSDTSDRGDSSDRSDSSDSSENSDKKFRRP